MGATGRWPDAVDPADTAERPRRPVARVVLVLAVVTSVLLFAAGFGALASVDLTADHPLAVPTALAVVFGVFSVVALTLFVIAVVLLIRRLRGAVVTAAVAFLLPAVATVAAVWGGVVALEENATDDLNSAGALVVRIGDLVERWGGPGAEPLRDIGRTIQG